MLHWTRFIIVLLSHILVRALLLFTMATIGLGTQYTTVLRKQALGLSSLLAAGRTARRVGNLFSVRIGPLYLSHWGWTGGPPPSSASGTV